MEIRTQERNQPNLTLLQILENSRKVQLENDYDTSNFDLFIKAAKKDESLGSVLIKNFIGNGSSAAVFETPEGDILKLSVGSHFPMGRPQEEFDNPIKEHGKVGKVHYYVEEKLSQHDMPEYFAGLMRDRIKAAGYKIRDLSEYDVHQIGLSKTGELYLLDPECARFKTIFHALWYKAKHCLLKIRL